MSRHTYKRTLQGEKQPHSKLTNAQYDELCRRLKDGEDPKALAVEFGISYTYCTKIRRGGARVARN